MLNFKIICKYWDEYTYPWRPGKSFCKFIESKIKSNSKVCILGATTEFRAICKKKGCLVDLYDLSPHMLEVSQVGNTKEKIHIMNWLDIQGKEYDLIIGDLILFLLPNKTQSKLLGILRNNTSKNGEVILRIGGAKSNNQEELQTYIKKINDFSLSTINKLCYDLKIGKGYTEQEIFHLVKENNSVLYSCLYENFYHKTPYGNNKITPFMIQKSEWQSILRTEFTYSYEEIITII